jgi:tRNA-dihydrouridine synthase
VRYDLIAQAVRELRCPVFANGNVHSAAQAQALVRDTGVRGLMIGRGAIRNPWLFDQIRAQFRGEEIKLPSGRDVLNYIRELWENEITPGVKESSQVMRMKKFMNFIGDGVDEKFLHEIRRVETTADFFRVCENYFDHDELMTLEPFQSAGIISADCNVTGPSRPDSKSLSSFVQ